MTAPDAATVDQIMELGEECEGYAVEKASFAYSYGSSLDNLLQARAALRAAVERVIQERDALELLQKFKQSPDASLMERAERAEARLAEAEETIRTQYALLNAQNSDNFKLAAGQCIVDGGLLGDDYGHQYCAVQRERDDASMVATRFEEENVRLLRERDALKELLRDVRRRSFDEVMNARIDEALNHAPT